MTPIIIGLYAGILALMLIPLSFRVIRMRYRKRNGFGFALIGSRTLHAIGLSRSSGATRPRVLGMVLTFTVLVGNGLTAIGQFVGV